MKVKVLALMAIAGLFTASLAFAAPASTADDMPGMNSNSMTDGTAAPAGENIGNSGTGVDMGPLASNDTMNTGMGNMSNSSDNMPSSTPGNTPNSTDSSNNNDDMSADTATGDDDY